MDRAPSHVLPHTIWLVFLWTERNRFGEGVNRLGSIGSSVIVGRVVEVKVGEGVSVMMGVPVGGVVVGADVLITNKSGVLEACNAKGVAVGCGGLVGVGDCKNGIETGKEEQPARMETSTAM